MEPGKTPVMGPMSGRSIIGEVTEAMHRFLLDGYNLGLQPPRFEEDLKFVPKDREEVVYIYMYRLSQNPNLQNTKRPRVAPVFVNDDPEDGGEVYYHRPPMLMDLFYLVMCHSKFRSDAERLLGWVVLRLHESTHLIYRPRRFVLPDGREVDSLGRPYNPAASPSDENLYMEKVSVALVDDLTVGDAINLFNLFEAPYRPFLTYRARVALDGGLVASSGGTGIQLSRLAQMEPPGPRRNLESPSGRIIAGRPTAQPKQLPGPKAHFFRRKIDADPDTED